MKKQQHQPDKKYLELEHAKRFIDKLLDRTQYNEFDLSDEERINMRFILESHPGILVRQTTVRQFHGTSRKKNLDAYDRNFDK